MSAHFPTDLNSNSPAPSTSSTSIFSQQSSIASSSSSGNTRMPSTRQDAEDAMSNEKKQLDLLLNTAMTELHAKFGQHSNQNIQQEIQKKLNALKTLVSTIEKRAKQKHVEIDMKLDQAQITLKSQTKLQHQQLDTHGNLQLHAVYLQFKHWMDALDTSNQE